jgi:hypothetical protein
MIKPQAFVCIFPEKVVQINNVGSFSTICKLVSLFDLIDVSILNAEHCGGILTEIFGNCRLNSCGMNVGRDVLLVLVLILFK